MTSSEATTAVNIAADKVEDSTGAQAAVVAPVEVETPTAPAAPAADVEQDSAEAAPGTKRTSPTIAPDGEPYAKKVALIDEDGEEVTSETFVPEESSVVAEGADEASAAVDASAPAEGTGEASAAVSAPDPSECGEESSSKDETTDTAATDEEDLGKDSQTKRILLLTFDDNLLRFRYNVPVSSSHNSFSDAYPTISR